ncbi:helix-loop-helix DNA-binding domain-containing protein [Hyaloscypha finlandica]|nr:helix-loop-helix DNA-binding domain-containing protein [Hyaloscypha finlandica]
MRWDDPSDAALSPTSTDNNYFPDFKLEPTSPSMNMNSLELQGGISSNQNNIQSTEDSAIFGEVNEEPLFQTPGRSSLITPPLDLSISQENLYSTPLSWARPQQRANSYASLTPQEESKLRSIAMPPTQQPPTSQDADNYPASPSLSSSPEPSNMNRRKRKTSVEDDEREDSPPPTSNSSRPVKKTAHNMIEKRYRTNLNDKIAALRDSVPSLRVMGKKGSRGELHEDLQGLTPAHKLNKATVLSKATEYIAHLEKRNRYLVKENAALKSRVDAFEILVMSRQQPGQQQMQVQAQAQKREQQRRQSSHGIMGGQQYMM